MRSADGFPGVADVLFGQPCGCSTPTRPAPPCWRGRAPGAGRSGRAARPGAAAPHRDGAVWIGHVRRAARRAASGRRSSSPPRAAFAARPPRCPSSRCRCCATPTNGTNCATPSSGPHGARVGWLRFDFHNGAMSERQCERLRDALRAGAHARHAGAGARRRRDFFSNGIHLHDIEAVRHATPATAPPTRRWRNIEAIDDVALELLTLTDRLTVAALRGQRRRRAAASCAGGRPASGRMPAWCSTRTTRTWATCTARSTGPTCCRAASGGRAARHAARDAGPAADGGRRGGVARPGRRGASTTPRRFAPQALQRAPPRWPPRTICTERVRQAARSRDDERASRWPPTATRNWRMHRNFYGFDPSYHVARHHFVHRKPHAWTPRHLALHRVSVITPSHASLAPGRSRARPPRGVDRADAGGGSS
jgi:putative two-component system hydrogenase maturation factor HypX/HoxX